MIYEPFFVKITYKEKVFTDFGRDSETPQNCAKRILKQNTGLTASFVKAISGTQRMEISSVDPRISAQWPKGAKTIPIYEFTV